MHTIVSEPGVSLDTRFLAKDVIVLSLEVANDLSKAGGVSTDYKGNRRPLT